MTDPTYHIRPAVADDAEQIIAIMKVLADERDNGTSYSSADEFTYTLEQERDLLTYYADSPHRLWLVAESQGSIIGYVSVNEGKRSFSHTVSLAIAITQEWRQQGVGTALMRAMIEWCRTNPNIKRLELDVFMNNPRAIHVYEKLGFEREGIARASAYKHGEYLDSLKMAMLFDR
jgi:L-phenylalanine/L-methionine N-acetyltransferase